VNRISPIGWLAIAAVAWLVFSANQTAPGTKPEGPDLLPAFKQTDNFGQARQDAEQLAALCDSIADAIEYDGARGEQSRLTTGVQLDNLRRWSREYLLRGDSFGTKYPQLPEVIGKYLDNQVGTKGGPVDIELRKRWVTSHRQLALCAKWAAGQL
jgi:hypothetical protein